MGPRWDTRVMSGGLSVAARRPIVAHFVATIRAALSVVCDWRPAISTKLRRGERFGNKQRVGAVAQNTLPILFPILVRCVCDAAIHLTKPEL